MKTEDSVVYKLGTVISKNIAAFDLDSTLIVPGATAGRKKAAAADSSWKWWNDAVPKKLKELIKTHTIVVFSNQSGLSGKKAAEQRKTLERKIAEIEKALGFDDETIFFYFASGHDRYRKPSTSMWELFLRQADLGAPGVPVYGIHAFYVGDAAGRPGDHAASDVFFAHNCGIEFYTPEAYFLGDKKSKPGKTIYDTDPKLFTDLIVPPTKYKKEMAKLVTLIEKPTAIFMCGPPASGKTSVAKAIVDATGATWINQDTLKTKAKMFTAIRIATTAGESIIIDKTFGDVKSRAEYLEKIPDSYKKIVVVMHIKREQAEHLNWIRTGLYHVGLVPDIVYATFYKYWVEPETSEGFDMVADWSAAVPSDSDIAEFIDGRYVS